MAYCVLYSMCILYFGGLLMRKFCGLLEPCGASIDYYKLIQIIQSSLHFSQVNITILIASCWADSKSKQSELKHAHCIKQGIPNLCAKKITVESSNSPFSVCSCHLTLYSNCGSWAATQLLLTIYLLAAVFRTGALAFLLLLLR
jgi:hypothetical protein